MPGPGLHRDRRRQEVCIFNVIGTFEMNRFCKESKQVSSVGFMKLCLLLYRTLPWENKCNHCRPKALIIALNFGSGVGMLCLKLLTIILLTEGL